MEKLGNRVGIASAVHQLGTLAHHGGDYDEAERHYLYALAIDEELGNRAGLASSHGQLGKLAQDRGDYAEAEDRYRKTLALTEALGNRSGTANTYTQLGVVCGLTHREAEAAGLHYLAFAMRDPAGQTQAINNLTALADLRESLGVEEFRNAVAAVAGDESIDELTDLLDAGRCGLPGPRGSGRA